MIKLVLDTNVFVSGLFWSGAPSEILEAWKNRRIKLILSHAILEEYIRVGKILAKKYPYVDISPLIDLITMHSDLFLPVKLPHPISRDPDDDKFIATALAANCQYIVSGDKDLLEINQYANITVIKPADFLKKHLKK